jgi:hypothetical protein
MKKILLFGSMLLSQGLLLAQDKNDAFVYIQGDKQTPIYIKMEGEMQARYSKNFVILNGLAPGPLHLDVLFQQNAYPTQKFILNIPESSQRAFVLKKVDNTKFALYDLNSGHYVTAGNKLEDDIMTDPNKDLQELVAGNTPVAAVPTTAPEQTTGDALPDFPSEKPQKKPKVGKPKKEKPVKEEEVVVTEPETEETAPVVAKEQAPAPKEKDERFLSFEMQQKQEAAQNENNNRRRNRREEERENNNTNADVPVVAEVPAKPNRSGSANCAEAMTEVAFDNFMQQLKNRTDEETRLAYIMKYGKNYCFTTQQVWITASTFSSQSSRYEAARVLKPKVVDADQYEQLLKLFNTNYLKQRFAKEVIGQ